MPKMTYVRKQKTSVGSFYGLELEDKSLPHLALLCLTLYLVTRDVPDVIFYYPARTGTG